MQETFDRLCIEGLFKGSSISPRRDVLLGNSRNDGPAEIVLDTRCLAQRGIPTVLDIDEMKRQSDT
jgi:hypothetical protein